MRDLVLLLITMSSSATVAASSPSSVDLLHVVVFGSRQQDDARRIRHGTAFAFDTHRRLLTTVMEIFRKVEHQMRSIDERTGCYRHIHDRFRRLAATVPGLWEANEDVLRRLVVPTAFDLTYALLDTSDSAAAATAASNVSSSSSTKAENEDPVNESASYDSLEQVIVHLSRDWSSRGHLVRQRLYIDGILPTLANVLPPSITGGGGGSGSCDSSTRPPRLLVPGAGLGRLALELAARGYVVEVNECSGVMVSALHTLVTDILPNLHFGDGDGDDGGGTDIAGTVGNSLTFYPHVSSKLLDNWDFALNLKVATIPATDSRRVSDWAKNARQQQYQQQQQGGHVHNVSGQFAIQMGAFEDVYGVRSNAARFDAVVTCFFIDTAIVLQQTIAVIAHLLPVGGIWLNAGPLHYHDKRSVPYSYVEFVDVARALGFELVSHDQVDCSSYSGEQDLSMRPEYYYNVRATSSPSRHFQRWSRTLTSPLARYRSMCIAWSGKMRRRPLSHTNRQRPAHKVMALAMTATPPTTPSTSGDAQISSCCEQ
jgi:hypothetical protein